MKITRSFYLDTGLHEALKQWAKTNRVTTNEALSVLLSQALGLGNSEVSETDKLWKAIDRIVEALDESRLHVNMKGLR